MRTNGVRELIQPFFIEMLSGLLGVGQNPVNIDLSELVGLDKFRSWGPQQGAQTPPEGFSLLCHE